MIVSLGDILRAALSPRQNSTAAADVHLAESYIAIQQLRYRSRAEFALTASGELEQWYLPHFTLQPLVENALYHGIKNKRGGGCIVLRGYEDRNGLVFEVEDDGIGMDEAELAAVRAKLTLEPEEELAPIGSGGFGLHNVAQRIQMYYGDQAEILVESEKNIGTCFKVYLGNQKKS